MRLTSPVSDTLIHLSVPYLDDITFNTPILALHYSYNWRPGVLYVKQENAGITGHGSDRVALYTLKRSDATRLPHYSPQNFKGEEFMKCSLEGLLDRLSEDDKIDTMDRFILKGDLGRYTESEWEHIMEKVHSETTFEEVHYQLLFKGIEVDAFVSSRVNDGLLAAAGKFFKPKLADFKLGFITNESVSSYVNIVADLYQLVSNCEITKMMACLRNQLGLNIGPVSASNILGAIKLQATQLKGATVLTTLVDRNDDHWLSQLVGDRCDSYQMPDLVFTSFNVIQVTV